MYLLTIGVIGTDTITSLCSTREYNCGFMHARQARYRISYIPSLYLVFLLSSEKKCACSFSPNLSHSVWLLLLYPHKILPNLLSSQDVNCITCTFAGSSAPSHGVLCNVEPHIPSETRLLWGRSCSYASVLVWSLKNWVVQTRIEPSLVANAGDIRMSCCLCL